MAKILADLVGRLSIAFLAMPFAVRSLEIPLSRRTFVQAGSFLPLSFLHRSAAVASESTQTYSDPAFGIEFKVPAAWQRVDSKLSSDDRVGATNRGLTVFVDPADSKTNAFILKTPIQGDYTSLNSFGTVDHFVQTVLLPNGTDGELIDAKSSNQKYYFDYKIKGDGVVRRLKSVFAVVHSGPTDMLATFTIQTEASSFERSPELQSIFSAAVDSLR